MRRTLFLASSVARRLVALVVALAAPLAVAPAALAQPGGEPIHLLVGFAAGGGTDLVARIVAEPLGKRLGTGIVVDNRPGAGGVVAMEELRRSRPDGRTLLFSATGTLVMLPHIQRVPFDIEKDFSYIGTVTQYPLVIVVPASLGPKTLAEFVAYAKKNPGKLSYSSAGIGTGNHFSGEVFKKETGVDLTHVPYKSDGAALPDLLEGRIAMHMMNINLVMPHIRTGKLIALAVTGPVRAPDLPNVPTVAEAGFPTVEQAPWTALLGPASMKPELVARIASALTDTLADPEVKRRIGALGQDVVIHDPAETRRFVARESQRYKAIAESAKMMTE
ncbi:MAG TPA: tripartite tricarboxylate transporter substrate binding protein [Burkholderiaceae bacterium]|jgi:tripartite-type tricarboxylate transporter receptor subunit TctC